MSTNPNITDTLIKMDGHLQEMKWNIKIQFCQYGPVFPTYKHFLMPLQQMTFENIVAKIEIAHNEEFLLLLNVFNSLYIQ